MSDIVIHAENLGKKYTIGHHAENGNYTALRDVLVHGARGLWHKTKDLVQGKPLILGDTLEDVWALKDISFEIHRGQAVGIIGRNGAGKSTLLKILSRITEPSVGRVALRGRVASLLEVGTGFHPELSGRENIYLNGAILGMTRQEIKRKFDEIVAFAEVEKFLDTPVKRYSSGMYVRLAFAVAAHLEPEILVVDEVLAVGDAAFQKKCLGKMEDVSGEGRTVLFVSHNMAAIRTLCSESILLDAGRIACIGPTAKCIDQYLSGSLTQSKSILAHLTRIDSKLELESIKINGSPSDHLALPSGSRQLLIEIEGGVSHPIQMELEVRVQDIYGSPLAFFSPGHERGYAGMYPVGPFSLRRCIELPNITHGTYYLSLHLTHPGVTGFADIPNAVQVAAEGPVTATGFSIDYEGAGWVFLEEKPIQETR
jgi:lipopolysaccharide transport system ATP-binding protein